MVGVGAGQEGGAAVAIHEGSALDQSRDQRRRCGGGCGGLQRPPVAEAGTAAEVHDRDSGEEKDRLYREDRASSSNAER